ncbi:MAG: reverse transcriptase family protein, partial [Candidatus Thiodiazotropha endolucinida]
MIEICKNNNLFILNGRLDKDRNIGAFTFRHQSVIDYMLSSVDSLQFLEGFEILETDPLFSDGHCILTCIFTCPEPRLKQQTFRNNTRKPLWNEKFAHNFCGNIDLGQVDFLSNSLDSPIHTKRYVNEVTERILHIFQDASARTFPPKCKTNLNRVKPWFGPCCKSARKKYHIARKIFHLNKNDRNRARLQECSKQYKVTMNKFISKHNKATQKKLRNLQTKSPKQYWKFINSLKRYNCSATPILQEFYDHFKLLNLGTDGDDDTFHFDDTQNNDLLNSEITSDEILRCIRNLNNGKASGLDMILNEYIKSSCHIFLPLYEKFFNLILDTGHFPEQWSTGCIYPIYKNKGTRENVQNYRPITILSCLGKLFTGILNSRLNEYLEESMLLDENQAGFRKHYSTLDHIFSLYALTEILKSQKQKLFCCFVDFSSAFDSVWRVGLWHKLLQSKVNGKILNDIINMYRDIKSCVSLLGEESAFFSSLSGVRQGENLSPVLFSLYLNDLESFLLHNSTAGITIDYDTNDFSIFLKLIVLLYADDTVILANNESDLQFSLDRFNAYCQTWKLKVNIDKTKIIIFGARKTNSYNFSLGDNYIEITDKYKYLGVYFSQSRSFLNARKHIVEQSKKAMYLLFCRINNLKLPVDLQLKLFDHTVLPILTYACEIWGFENLEMLEKIHTEFLRKIT